MGLDESLDKLRHDEQVLTHADLERMMGDIIQSIYRLREELRLVHDRLDTLERQARDQKFRLVDLEKERKK